jgi:hypothetical protein
MLGGTRPMEWKMASIFSSTSSSRWMAVARSTSGHHGGRGIEAAVALEYLRLPTPVAVQEYFICGRLGKFKNMCCLLPVQVWQVAHSLLIWKSWRPSPSSGPPLVLSACATVKFGDHTAHVHLCFLCSLTGGPGCPRREPTMEQTCVSFVGKARCLLLRRDKRERLI